MCSVLSTVYFDLLKHTHFNLTPKRTSIDSTTSNAEKCRLRRGIFRFEDTGFLLDPPSLEGSDFEQFIILRMLRQASSSK